MHPYEHSDPITRINRRNKRQSALDRKEFITSELSKINLEKVLSELRKDFTEKYSAIYSLYSNDSGYELQNSLKEPFIQLEENKYYDTVYVHPDLLLTVELEWIIQDSIPKVFYRIIGNYTDVKFTYSNNKEFTGDFKWNDDYYLTINVRGKIVRIWICLRKYN